ncbi:MAG: hypothetical protein U9Q74_15275, partial [Gemmatimonadota bacterium]|nr:hypothetical protein [Gemmatimonadota bacterium]
MTRHGAAATWALLALALAICLPAGAAQIINPGFEEGLDGWTASAATATPEQAPGATGRRALRIADGWVVAEAVPAHGWQTLTLRARPV